MLMAKDMRLLQWQHANVTTAGGSFLYLVNGQDRPQLYNGTTWTAIDGASTPSITGVTTSNLVHVCVFKSRLYFVVKNSMQVVFLPVGQVGGAVGTLDMSAIFRDGGSIMACYTWTVDAGAGADDHFVVISTMGEVAIYRGSNPGAGGDFSIVGVFQLGKPLGRRCAEKYGGDLAVNTTEGVFPLGRGLLSASVDRTVALTDKIQNSVSIAANSTRSLAIARKVPDAPAVAGCEKNSLENVMEEDGRFMSFQNPDARTLRRQPRGAGRPE